MQGLWRTLIASLVWWTRSTCSWDVHQPGMCVLMTVSAIKVTCRCTTGLFVVNKSFNHHHFAHFTGPVTLCPVTNGGSTEIGDGWPQPVVLRASIPGIYCRGRLATTADCLMGHCRLLSTILLCFHVADTCAHVSYLYQ